MKKREAINIISNFTGLQYSDFKVCLDNGKKYGLNDCRGLDFVNQGGNLILNAELEFCGIELCFEKDADGSFCVSLKLKNLSSNISRVSKLIPFCVKIPSDEHTTVLIQSDLESGIRKFNVSEKGCSKYHISVGNGNGKDATFVSVIPLKFRTKFEYEFKGDYTSVSCATIFPKSYEGDFYSEKTRIFLGVSAVDAVKREADRFADVEYEHPVGWSTWDYYAFDISDDCIKENVELIYKDKLLSKYVKYIAIDNGWQQMDGDWNENGRMKSGLKEFCRYINSKGMKAGIWTAPARVNTNSANAMREIYDILSKNEYCDSFIYEGTYVLDPTHPKSERFIKNIFTYLKKCGFEFYKIDFLNYVTEADYFWDKTAGHYDALRKLISIIRDTVGKDAHIMGCGMPYGIGQGYVNSRRTGLDIHTFWGHIKKCTEYYLPQFAAHNKIYFNDLDYLVVRGTDTCDSAEKNNVTNPYKHYCEREVPTDSFFWLAGKDFTYDESKFWASVVLMSGSSIFLGDKLSRLNEKGRKLIERTLLNADFTSAEPHGLLNYPLPEIWCKKSLKKLFVFNWDNFEKTVSVNVEELFGKDFVSYIDMYSDEKFIAENGNISFHLKPHQSFAVKATENG